MPVATTFRSLILFTVLFASGASRLLCAQELSKHIVVDQFGYRTEGVKVAVLRDPQTGFDGAEAFTPGATYAVVDKATGIQVLTGAPATWNSGAEDASSGDKAWWFDFSSVTAAGTYYILDVANNKRSYEFVIDDDVYKEVLKHAVRAFFYQRAGFEKSATYAGAAWADGASHTKNLQDKNARQYNKTSDATSEVDVSGGWYDAGDYNKYTNWTANYVVDFMRAYIENPGAWGDDYNLPESGNKIPDLLDEAKWGVDHLLRMQRPNGSVLSIVGLSHASPPSSATGPSYYGTPSTSATLNSAGAFAIASRVYGSRGMTEYAATLREAAVKAWDWASANPSVIFRNNDAAAGTAGLGAGQQETDDYGRLIAKLEAAVFLFELTGEAKYREFFDANYDDAHLIQWTYAYPFETSNQEVLLHYTTLPGATASVVTAIRDKYAAGMNGEEVFPAVANALDPYRAYIKTTDYGWGSNSTKGAKGLMFTDLIYYGVTPAKDADAKKAAEDFIHYLHGVNPLNMVYLSNMYAYGADNSVNEFYHTWFGNGSAKWDRVGTSTYGPAPGFVTGGPNPYYNWDGCCPAGCGGSSAVCNSESIAPPKGQPAQKSYKDFNTSWPLNSWEVTENSNGYQLNYIRLLSKFVTANYDCSGTENGSATFDVCHRCTGGTTGLTPITDDTLCPTVITSVDPETVFNVHISPNPTTGVIAIENKRTGTYTVKITDALGRPLITGTRAGNATFHLGEQPAGVYLVVVQQQQHVVIRKIVKK